MAYRTAADILEQMFPVDTGRDKETLRRHTLSAGAKLRDGAAIRPQTPAPAITVTVDSTFIRSFGCSPSRLLVTRRHRFGVRVIIYGKQSYALKNLTGCENRQSSFSNILGRRTDCQRQRHDFLLIPRCAEKFVPIRLPCPLQRHVCSFWGGRTVFSRAAFARWS
jgi:hypothetical protein